MLIRPAARSSPSSEAQLQGAGRHDHPVAALREGPLGQPALVQAERAVRDGRLHPPGPQLGRQMLDPRPAVAEDQPPLPPMTLAAFSTWVVPLEAVSVARTPTCQLKTLTAGVSVSARVTS